MTDDQPKRLYTADELIALDIPETNFYLEPFIPTEGVVLLFGKPSTYKTTLIYNMANAIASGSPLWGITPTQASPILVLELDTPLPVIKTRFAGCLTPGTGVHTFFHHGLVDFVAHADIHDSVLLNAMRDFHTKHNYKVVFVDTLSRVHMLDEIKAQSVSPVYAALQRIFPGATIVFVHHGKKSGLEQTEDMRVESFSGSQQWAAQCQIAIMVSHTNKAEGKIALEIVKSQVAEGIPALRLEVDGWTVRLEGEAKIDRVGAILADLPRGMPKGDMDKAVAKALGVSATTAKRRRLVWEKTQPGFGTVLQLIQAADPPEPTETKQLSSA